MRYSSLLANGAKKKITRWQSSDQKEFPRALFFLSEMLIYSWKIFGGSIPKQTH